MTGENPPWVSLKETFHWLTTDDLHTCQEPSSFEFPLPSSKSFNHLGNWGQSLEGLGSETFSFVAYEGTHLDQIIQQNAMKERRASMIKTLFLLVLHHTKKIQFAKHSFDSFLCFFVCFFCFPTLRKSLFLALSTSMNLEKLRWTWGKGVPSDTHPIIPSRQPQNTTRFPETSLPSLLLRI